MPAAQRTRGRSGCAATAPSPASGESAPSRSYPPKENDCGNAVPSAGVAIGGSLLDWAVRLCKASLEPRVFPLPPLQRPRLRRRGSPRLRARASSRRRTWLAFESLRMTLNTMYSDHLAVGHVRGGFRPLHLCDMPAPRQAATAELLGVVKSFLGSRRETRAPTGGSALQQVLKV